MKARITRQAGRSKKERTPEGKQEKRIAWLGIDRVVDACRVDLFLFDP